MHLVVSVFAMVLFESRLLKVRPELLRKSGILSTVLHRTQRTELRKFQAPEL